MFIYYQFRIIYAYISGYYNNNNSFITDVWSLSQVQSNNEAAQKMVGHSALQNRCLHTTNTDRSKTL